MSALMSSQGAIDTKLIKIKTNPDEGEKVFKEGVKCIQKPGPPDVNKEGGWCGLVGGMNL